MSNRGAQFQPDPLQTSFTLRVDNVSLRVPGEPPFQYTVYLERKVQYACIISDSITCVLAPMQYGPAGSAAPSPLSLSSPTSPASTPCSHACALWVRAALVDLCSPVAHALSGHGTPHTILSWCTHHFDEGQPPLGQQHLLDVKYLLGGPGPFKQLTAGKSDP